VGSKGVYGFAGNSVLNQKILQPRSYFVNAELTAESDPQNMISCIWNDYMLFFINNHVYVADARMRNDNTRGSFGYEWFYWDNVPARSALVYRGGLYFGSETGTLYKFMTEEEYGMEAFSDDGKAITAVWSTKMDMLGDPARYKSINRAGTGFVVYPFIKTSGVISFKSEYEIPVKEYSMSSMFDFNHIDFDRFSFGMPLAPVFVPARKKMKKVKMFQMLIGNNRINEAFGVVSAIVEYRPTKNIKRI
jgi:hypothetical protein